MILLKDFNKFILNTIKEKITINIGGSDGENRSF